MDLSPLSLSFTELSGEVLAPIFRIGLLAVPLGWVLAGIALWRPLPHPFAILSRWFVGVHAASSAALLLVAATSFGTDGVDGMMLGFIAASVSGVLAWIVIRRRSRALEPMPSLL
jgi:hypothetical protein